MIKSLKILMTMACLVSTQANEINAPLILGKKLTPFWAQEYIGADLIKDELKKIQNLKKIDVAVIDIGFEKDHINLTEDIEVPPQLNGRRRMIGDHGTSVVNIFNGPYGITDQLNLMSLGRVNYNFLYSYYWDTYVESNRIPRIISNSVGWSDNQDIADIANEAFEKDVLWFLASGNGHPEEETSKVERESKALLIGSFSPSGLTSSDTQNHESLLVLAPANNELATIDGRGRHSLFGATSGATPMVAASVTNVLSFLPKLKHHHVIALIKKTAFKSVENKLGNERMPGLFNGYKFFKVAQRVAKQCPNQDKTCLDQVIKDREIYQFTKTKVISCKKFKMTATVDQDETLKAMRTSAFLGNNEQARELACAYDYIGFEKNAQYFRFITSDKLDLKAMEESAMKAIDEEIYGISYYRYRSHYSDKYNTYIKEHKKIGPYFKESLLSF
ncbi:peptidase, S8/S53 domain protein [Bacteriovorax sp. BAL6_X]|uniref:S8 family serine peptidase n=1 Tax=Bacteriovorax sp. BAL6_X TaxID=1201290 RepID=UPI000386204C|nr:S8 family serine peptidase [Bacteriovorax sp. BAL6_X]EPZ49906.1 peptidase, S8/S53 domain protein [Bacteriovorax sp. BAL6_X]